MRNPDAYKCISCGVMEGLIQSLSSRNEGVALFWRKTLGSVSKLQSTLNSIMKWHQIISLSTLFSHLIDAFSLSLRNLHFTFRLLEDIWSCLTAQNSRLPRCLSVIYLVWSGQAAGPVLKMSIVSSLAFCPSSVSIWRASEHPWRPWRGSLFLSTLLEESPRQTI